MRRLVFVAALLSVVPAATAAAQKTEIDLATKKEKPKSGGSNRITEEEIAYSQMANAYDAIQALRPRMLQVRAVIKSDGADPSEIVVFRDNIRLGGKEELRTIAAETIKEIRYLSASEATQRWGSGYVYGAILVVTKQ